MFSKILSVTLVLAVGLVLGEQVKFNGYKVYRMIPTNEDQVQIIKGLEDFGVNFWSGPNPPNRSSDVMVPPHLQGELIASIKKQGIQIEEYIPDVQTLIDQEGPVISKRAKGTPLAHDAYLRVNAIYDWLDEQAALHSDIASVEVIGQSFEGRDLKVLKVSKGGNGSKRIIWVDANIHAREWITNAVCLYLIDQVLNSNDPVYQQWTEDYDWYFFPMHNPDGYEWSHSDNRMWRKTRTDTGSPLGCKGADPNRNWGFHWLEGGSSTNPCSDTYAGSEAFSEPEAFHASEYIKTIADRIDFFLSLHSYSQLILIPYGVEIEFPEHDLYMEIGNKAKAAIAQKYNTEYTPGNIVDLLYVASGGSMDWAKGTFPQIPLTYTFEMRDTGRYGFLLPPELIVPTSEEFMDGMKVIIDEVRGMRPKKQTKPAVLPVIQPKPAEFRNKFFSLKH